MKYKLIPIKIRHKPKKKGAISSSIKSKAFGAIGIILHVNNAPKTIKINAKKLIKIIRFCIIGYYFNYIYKLSFSLLLPMGKKKQISQKSNLNKFFKLKQSEEINLLNSDNIVRIGENSSNPKKDNLNEENSKKMRSIKREIARLNESYYNEDKVKEKINPI